MFNCKLTNTRAKGFIKLSNKSTVCLNADQLSHFINTRPEVRVSQDL